MRSEKELRNKIADFSTCDDFLHQEVIYGDKSSFDCATFVKFMFRECFGIDVSLGGFGKSLTTRIMTSLLGQTKRINEKCSNFEKVNFLKQNAKAGDILLFHRQSFDDNEPTSENCFPGHLGIYLGDGKFVDARWRRGNVDIVDFASDEYCPVFVGVKDVISDLCLSNDNNNDLEM